MRWDVFDVDLYVANGFPSTISSYHRNKVKQQMVVGVSIATVPQRVRQVFLSFKMAAYQVSVAMEIDAETQRLFDCHHGNPTVGIYFYDTKL